MAEPAKPVTGEDLERARSEVVAGAKVFILDGIRGKSYDKPAMAYLYEFKAIVDRLLELERLFELQTNN